MTRVSVTIRKWWLERKPTTESKTSTQGFYQYFLRARALARAGVYDLAETAYQQAIDSEPTLVDAWEGLGEMLDVRRQPQSAMEKYAAARRLRAEMRPGPPDRHFVLRQRGHFATEILAYDAVVRSLKKSRLPYIARGNAYLASGRPENALANYNHALRLKRDLPDVMALKGEALSMLQRYDEAVRSFDVAVRARPNDAEALGGRAIARLGLGLIEEANADWQRQFKLLAGRASARACVALRMADYDAALPELERALEKEPNDPYWILYRLTARLRLGMSVDAASVPSIDAWPGPLVALYARRTTPAEVMKRADTEGRRAEALFHLGVLAFDQDRRSGETYWKDLVEHSSPSLIEYGATRNELARFSQ